ncbi:MAG TPA: class I tRNA ligase family protein [Euzebyales bacterium]
MRTRWRERRLRGRPDPPRDPDAKTLVVHAMPPAAGSDADTVDTAVLIATDVVARHGAMDGARIEHAAARHRSGATDELGRRLACDDDDIVHYDLARASYIDSAWWAVDQLWHAGLLYERRATAGTCDHDGHPQVPTVKTGRAVVRFPVTGDGALRTAGASLLVTAEADALPATTAVALTPGVDRVLAQAVDDAYPVVVARTAVPAVLGDGATVHRDVAVEELLAVTCRHPLDGGTGPVTVVPAPRSDANAGTGAHPVPSVAEDGPAAAQDRADGSARADRSDELLAELRERGLLLGTGHEDDDATAPTGTPTTCAQWVLATSRWRAQLHEEHGRVSRCGARPVSAWALGDEDWVVTGAGGPGPPLPLWQCDRCDAVTPVAGRSELATLTGEELVDVDPTEDVVTRATFTCPSCGEGTAHRVPLTLDARFLAAVMPFARFGFPAVPGSDGRVARRHHADVVVDDPDAEAADATLTVATLLWGAGGHDAVLCVEGPADVTDVSEMCDRHDSDAVRWAVLAAGTRPGDHDLESLACVAGRDIIEPLRRACALVRTAAEEAGLPSADAVRAPTVDTRDAWDRWLLAELSATVDEVRSCLAGADPGRAVADVHRAVAWLETWLRRRGVRALRAAFDPDALATAHEYLVTLAALLAPFMPLVADEVYEALVRAGDPAAPDSVHLLRFPIADPWARDDDLRQRMRAQVQADHDRPDSRAGDAPAGAGSVAARAERSAVDRHPRSDAPRRPATVR